MPIEIVIAMSSAENAGLSDHVAAILSKLGCRYRLSIDDDDVVTFYSHVPYPFPPELEYLLHEFRLRLVR